MSEFLNELPENWENKGVGRDDEIAQETKDILELKQRVLDELDKPGFPDLEFLFSHESIAVAEEILEDLLQKEQVAFQQTLALNDDEITFKVFERYSLFEYYFLLLRHFKKVQANDDIKGVIVKFSPKYNDFMSQQYQSSRYYEMLCFALNNLDLHDDQKRVLEIQKERCEAVGVHLDEDVKKKVLFIQSELSTLAEQFDDNIKTAAHDISFTIQDATSLKDMPDNLLQI